MFSRSTTCAPHIFFLQSSLMTNCGHYKKLVPTQSSSFVTIVPARGSKIAYQHRKLLANFRSRLRFYQDEKSTTGPKTDNSTTLPSTSKEEPTNVSNLAQSVLLETATTVKNTKRSSRIPLDLTASSLERNFVTPGRAMSDFLLKMEHLETLKATKRRSPSINKAPITVFWRKDVEQKALEVWGTKDNLLKEILRRQLERKYFEQSNATLKRQLKSSRKESLVQQDGPERGSASFPSSSSQAAIASSGLFGHSGRVVLSAVFINGMNFVVKLIAWIYTGSHSMFAECIHSLADTMNQLILAFGIYKSVQRPNQDHPYGYTNMKYVSSLISGVGIFCVGTGLSVYHGKS